MPTGNLTSAKPIAAQPWVVTTQDASVIAFLNGLPNPDFTATSDPKVLWAKVAGNSEAGTLKDPGSAYVVSAEAYKYVEAHRY